MNEQFGFINLKNSRNLLIFRFTKFRKFPTFYNSKHFLNFTIFKTDEFSLLIIHKIMKFLKLFRFEN